MANNPNYTPNAADILIGQLNEALKSYRRMSKKKQHEFAVNVLCAERINRNKALAPILNELVIALDLITFGWTTRKPEKPEADILDAEILEVKDV
jgi:hypothetical protein